MTRHVLSIEPAAGPAPGQAPVSRAPRRPPPYPAALKVVSSHAEAMLPVGPRTAQANEDAGGGQADANAWLKVPKGIAVGLLLAVPFWVALAVWLLW